MPDSPTSIPATLESLKTPASLAGPGFVWTRKAAQLHVIKTDIKPQNRSNNKRDDNGERKEQCFVYKPCLHDILNMNEISFIQIVDCIMQFRKGNQYEELTKNSSKETSSTEATKPTT